MSSSLNSLVAVFWGSVIIPFFPTIDDKLQEKLNKFLGTP